MSLEKLITANIDLGLQMPTLLHNLTHLHIDRAKGTAPFNPPLICCRFDDC